MHVYLKEVKQLQKRIKDSSKKIDKIQKKCKHSRILHKLLLDQYNCLGHSQLCADCGKYLGYSIDMLWEWDGIQSKTWIENKK
jgi:hypothetical protein